jgi:hypothetical protein
MSITFNELSADRQRLKKHIMFSLVQELGRDTCFQCGELIETVEEFSIEHKLPHSMGEDQERFWDMANIAYSHLSCNVLAGTRLPRKNKSQHGTYGHYVNHKCRCVSCKEAHAEYKREHYRKSKV